MRSFLVLHVAVDLVLAQVVGRHEVTHPLGPRVGGPAAPAPRSPGALFTRDDPRRPLLARPWQQVERPELVHADDDARIALCRFRLAVGDVVELEHPVLLGLEVRIVGLLVGLDHLKRDALLAEYQAQALVADVVDHPLSHQELGQLGQAPGRKGQVMVDRAAQRDLLDLPALGEGELRGPAAGVLGGQGVEPVVVEVVQDLADPIGRGEGHLGDLGHVHALGREQHHLGSSPAHHRSRRASHDLEQPSALFVGDLSNAYPVAHLTSSFARGQFCATGRSKWWTRPSNVAGHGTSWSPRPLAGAMRRSPTDHRGPHRCSPWSRSEVPRPPGHSPAQGRASAT